MPFDVSMLLLRLALGVIFVAHGWPKVKNMKMTAQHFESMGFKPGNLWGTLVGLVEFVGGLAVIFGVGMQVASLGIAIVMLIALFWKIGKGQGLVGGYELDLMLLATALALTLLAPGVYALQPSY
jgi:putative oxidoreductase